MLSDKSLAVGWSAKRVYSRISSGRPTRTCALVDQSLIVEPLAESGCALPTAAQSNESSGPAERLVRAGFRGVIPVVPPGAVLAAGTTLKAASLGKVPGVRRQDGEWTGVNWSKLDATEQTARLWDGWCSNVGLRTDYNPAVDLDIGNEALALRIQACAHAILGAAPVRIGRNPRRILLYRTVTPFALMQLRLTAPDGEPSMVEVLCAGRQFVAAGTHPTGVPYTWSEPLESFQPHDLAEVTHEQIDAFLTAMAEMLTAEGYVAQRVGDGRPPSRVATAEQVALAAPNYEVLAEAMAFMENHDEQFPRRDDYIAMGIAIKAAAGLDRDDDAFGLFLDWTAKWDSGVNDPDVVRADWRRMHRPFAIGWPCIADRARAFGFNAAGVEFMNIPLPAAKPTYVEEFNAKYGVVRGIAKGILYTPAVGPVDFMPVAHWKLVTANQLVSVEGNKGSIRQVAKSSLWLKSPERREYDRVVIDPSATPLAGVPSPNGGEDFNLWPGFALTPSATGSCALFLAHVRDVICSGDEGAYQWVIMWFAAMVQDPARLPGTALILKGVQGSGKTIVGEILSRMLGSPLAVMVSGTEELTGNFNSRLENKVLIMAEEAFFAGDHKVIGKLKTLITAPTISIERKGIDSIIVTNLAHVLITSNERWVVPADANGERRMMVLEVDPVHATDRSYFGALSRQMYDEGGCARLLDHLKREVVVDWDTISKPFATDAIRDQQLQGLDTERRWLYDLLQEGSLPGNNEAEVCTVDDLYVLYRAFVRDQVGSRRVDKASLGRLLAGYVVRRAQFRVAHDRIWHYEFKPLKVCRDNFAQTFATPLEWQEAISWQNASLGFPCDSVLPGTKVLGRETELSVADLI